MLKDLTPKELEIFTLLLEGKSPKEIGYSLSISYDTVITHQKNIYRKLEVNSIRELFAKFKNQATLPKVALPKAVSKATRKLPRLKVIVPASAVLIVLLFMFILVLQKKDVEVVFSHINLTSDENSTVSMSSDGGAITISGLLYDNPNYEMTEYGYNTGDIFSGIFCSLGTAANKALPKMKSVSFMALGDGGTYSFKLTTHETRMSDRWMHIFTAPEDEPVLITVNVPQDLIRRGFSGQYIEFIKENIIFFQFNAVRPGPYELKVWDIRIHR